MIKVIIKLGGNVATFFSDFNILETNGFYRFFSFPYFTLKGYYMLYIINNSQIHYQRGVIHLNFALYGIFMF